MNNIFFNVPLPFLLSHQEILAQHPVNAEIFVDGEDLDHLAAGQVETAKRLFGGRNLKLRVHAPLSDMILGAFDSRIRAVSVLRMKQAIDFAVQIGAASATIHSGYDALNKRGQEKAYTEKLILALREISAYAGVAGKRLMLENTFEPTPDILLDAISGVNADNLRLCFDVAHHHLFAGVPIGEWIKRTAPFIEEVHITDNKGEWDDHLAPGQGEIDFETFFMTLKKNSINPAFTFEPHDVEAFVATLMFVRQHPEYFNR